MLADKSKIKIAFVTTYPPRQCGIATFSKSLIDLFDQLYIRSEVKVVAVSDHLGAYKYDEKVIFEIEQDNPESYVKAADEINDSNIEVVVLEHEYGIYGGENGDYILYFLERINRPVITSLHSVLDRKMHSAHRLELTQKILDLSDTVVVMTHGAKESLLKSFEIERERIQIVPHGVPNVRFDDKEKVKKKRGFANRVVLSTFGLINRGKGIEIGIEAVQKMVESFPRVLYLVIGGTHPAIKKTEGEAYREELENLVKTKGLEENVRFINKYLSYSELVDYLLLTDIYLAPQLDFLQAFSGTISYAMGCGTVVISSPTKYAKEVLANQRGIIIEPKARKIANALNKILSSDKIRTKYQLEAYNYARDMIWPKVSLNYLSVVESSLFKKNSKWQRRTPNFKSAPPTNHFLRLSDSFGIIQHTMKSKRNFQFGYSIDDQARALIFALAYSDIFGVDKQMMKRIGSYLDYLNKAIDEKGIVHNFINRNRQHIDGEGSSDSLARGLWALGFTISSKSATSEQKILAHNLLPYFEAGVQNFPKSLAYAILGYFNLGNKEKIKVMADTLVGSFQENNKIFGKEWAWYENVLTYANPIIPYALVKAFKSLGDRKYLTIALKSLSFLETVYYHKGVPSPVGQDGWYTVGGTRAFFDQQPLEAGDMVLLYNELYHLLGKKKYDTGAREWMGWYFGNNIKGVNVYDSFSQGVFDGITPKGLNRNQGAESIVTFLMAYISFHGGL